jgi:histidine ammonia-lyase
MIVSCSVLIRPRIFKDYKGAIRQCKKWSKDKIAITKQEVHRGGAISIHPIILNGENLTLESIEAVALGTCHVELCPVAKAKMLQSYHWVQDVCKTNKPVYGVNTGFGSLARVSIPPSQSSQLSTNLIRSHAAGVGPIADVQTTRTMVLLRANALAKGVSGCRPLLVENLVHLLNVNILPKIPMQGSCGSSGDLAPLAHLGLMLIGDPLGEAMIVDDSGKCTYLDAPAALHMAELAPLVLEAKDGLAITNGAQLSTAIATLNIIEGKRLLLAGELAASMSMEALLGISRAFHPAVHKMRPYLGAKQCAYNIRTLTKGSTLMDSVPEKLQDAYSIRCTPQVLGAVRDMMRFVESQISVEWNSATDNPLILLDINDSSQGDPDNKAFSAGMFHGEPIGMAMDSFKIAISELANLSERRQYRLTTGNLSQLLPPGLVGKDRPAIGMIVPQTTAAALVSENKALAWPASVDSIPTCEDQEDHIAMSTVAARRARDVLRNSIKVVAIELMSSAHALAFRLDERPNAQLGIGVLHGVSNVRKCLEETSSPFSTIGEQIEAIADRIQNGHILQNIPTLLDPSDTCTPDGEAL